MKICNKKPYTDASMPATNKELKYVFTMEYTT